MSAHAQRSRLRDVSYASFDAQKDDSRTREVSGVGGTFRDTVAVCCRHSEQVITQAGVGYARTDPCSRSLIGRRVTEAGRCC